MSNTRRQPGRSAWVIVDSIVDEAAIAPARARARERQYLVYNAIVLFFLPIFVVVGFGMGPMSPNGCRLSPSPEYFVSSCGTLGDYEHDAFWFGTEPMAISSLKDADVIFTGSSRTMFAFSTEEIRTYFSSRGLKYFNAGFGYEEQQSFFIGLARRWKLKPRVLVIGVDPYFDERISQPADWAMHRPLEIIAALAKTTALRLHPLMCRYGLSDCMSRPTAFRSNKDGFFVWRDILMPDREKPRSRIDKLRDFQINVPLAAIEANKFLKAVRMPSKCVILVPMPTHDIWRKPDPVKQLSEAIGSKYIDADTGSDLFLVDEMHLSFDSAKGFSSQFVKAFDKLKGDCL
jgi:hypothetical protein